MNNIQIKNIYYIVLYAWDNVKNKGLLSDKKLERIDNPNEVIIELFLNGVSRLTKKGKFGQYIENIHSSIYIKGKIHIHESIKLTKPNLKCIFDEFSCDNLLNQIIKTVLVRIYRIKGIDLKLKRKAKTLLLKFDNINEIHLRKSLLNKIKYNQLNRDYRFIIDLGMFIYNNCIPTMEIGRFRFIDILEDEEQMNLIFENFLKNFIRYIPIIL